MTAMLLNSNCYTCSSDDQRCKTEKDLVHTEHITYCSYPINKVYFSLFPFLLLFRKVVENLSFSVTTQMYIHCINCEIQKSLRKY